MNPESPSRSPSIDTRSGPLSGTPPEGGRCVDSQAILEGHTEVVIRHNGRNYRLRCTRLGKLILTA